MGKTYCKQCNEYRELLTKLLYSELELRQLNGLDTTDTIQHLIDNGIPLPKGRYLVEKEITVPSNMSVTCS